MSNPYSVSGQNRYCRLFAPGRDRPSSQSSEIVDDLTALYALTKEMTDDGSILADPELRVTIQAGYTYFGQFIDHDLTNDRSEIRDTWLYEPEQLENRLGPWLDLSHIYGRGPFDDEHWKLYEGVRLRVGAPPPGSSQAFDIACDLDGQPLVADCRSCENVILREMVAVFCCLHNLAIEQFRSRYTGNPQGLFERARQYTCWQFQKLVVEDYLPRVLDPTIFDSVFLRGRTRFRWNVFSIPVEFSAAAMRFGHSMVRDRYFLGDRDFDLDELLIAGRTKGLLPHEYKIDWGRLIQNAGSAGTALTAQPIDTGIAKSLHRISLPTIILFNPATDLVKGTLPILTDLPPTLPLPFLSLWRGLGLRLPSGQDVAESFGEKVLLEQELLTNLSGQETGQGAVLNDNGLLEQTPLWFYILKESEMRCLGNCLGPTGSRVVAETIYASLLHDPNSYFNHPLAKDLVLDWNFPAGKRRIQTLRDLFAHADDLFNM